MKFQIFKRKARWRRRLARRGEDYDGSRWELHKSYETKEDAEKALANFIKKGMPDVMQYKLIEK
jgi:hypothetical protein